MVLSHLALCKSYNYILVFNYGWMHGHGYGHRHGYKYGYDTVTRAIFEKL